MSKFTEYRNATWTWIKDKSGKVYAAAKANAIADPWWTVAWFTIGGASTFIFYSLLRLMNIVP